MKETIIEMNTMDGQSSIKMDRVKGQLDGIIIDSKEKCEIILESEYGYIILHRRQHSGVKYYCIRERTTTPVESLLDYPSFDRFNLNEDLIVTIRVLKNQVVKFIFRFI